MASSIQSEGGLLFPADPIRPMNPSVLGFRHVRGRSGNSLMAGPGC